MIGRREVLRKLWAMPLGAVAAAGVFGLAGCGQDEGLPALPISKSKDDFQKDNENLPGIPVKDSRKRKK
ncbi:hypothetical protein P12x_005864 [Tundrisphaera lichenicola]|uniref:hypothetical protein n=1 Tax=Tundrisphaera lichenicola TaxID=2029860 RepID=UPI003EBF43CC